MNSFENELNNDFNNHLKNNLKSELKSEPKNSWKSRFNFNFKEKFKNKWGKNLKNGLKDESFLFLLGIIALFLIIKISQMGFKFSDENIYFYMGNMILQGNLPYRDFFFASPPFQILIISGLLSIFGSRIILLKLIPLIAVSISSVFIFLFVKKISNKFYAIFSSVIYLFSFVVLTTTDHSTGIHLTTMFLLISFYLVEKEKFLTSGIFSSFALLTRLYSGVGVLGIAIYLLIKNRKSLFRYIIGISIVFIPANALLFSLFGKDYLNSVFLYHLLKSEGIPKNSIFLFFLRWDFIPIMLSIPSIFLKNRKKIMFPSITGLTILFFYIFYADIYYLYLGLLIPFISIMSGWTLYSIYNSESSNDAYQSLDIKYTPENKNLNKNNILLFSVLLLIFVITFNTYFYINDHASTSKIDFIEDITEYVKENSLEGDKIYGNFEITPLIALMSKRNIYGNYIDTNEKTFLTGMYDSEERTDSIRGNVKFVIMKYLVDFEGNILNKSPIIQESFLENECDRVKSYAIKKDYSDNYVMIFDCLG